MIDLLIHGTEDKQVYFLNSQNAFDAMKKQGAFAGQLVPLPGKAHDTGIPDYLVRTLQFFSTLPQEKTEHSPPLPPGPCSNPLVRAPY